MKVKIIAEIGANHNGDIVLAKEMAHAAFESGCDYAKFQSWQSHKIPPGPWDKEGPFFQYKTKRDFYNSAELSDQDHYDLIEYCDSVGIKFLTTCFDRERNNFLSTLSINTIKVASCDLTSLKMIKDLTQNFETILVSTGMSTIAEIEKTRDVLVSSGKNFALLYCVAEYPTPLSSVSLDRMLSIRSTVPSKNNFGLSDHSLGTSVAKVAIANGATWVEKHFTIDRNIPGPDNHMSMLPEQMRDIRNFSNDFEKMNTSYNLEPTDNELNLRKIVIGRFGDNA
ncbi:MAG: hypothetical protein CMB80_17860 [Flammeovirgaceae bacterium]|nr:hypothetical protein [Flammeovirgaceae bacterium]|tara:strand:+ start:1296 stop:2141 length:846 start_codon:yes stop_codon:yes gene_type:complete